MRIVPRCTGERERMKWIAKGFWKMQALKPGFEATDIEERYSRQRKEQNHKQQKAKRKVCLDRSNHVLLGFSVFEGE